MQHFKRKITLKKLGVVVLAGFSFHAGAEEAVLLTVKVEAAVESDTRPVQGYNAKKSTAATKTDTELIDVPQSITVITQEVMKDQSVQSMSDAVRYVPGVTASQGEGNRDAINFRGAGVSTGDFFLDGVRDDVQTYRDFYNTDRIEVLKGPNGMIFGRGVAGGAINRVSKEAGWDPVRELTVSVGAYEHKRTTLDVGNAINEIAAFRVNAVVEDSDSYRDGVETQRHGINPTLTLMPTDHTRITLGYEYFKDEHVGDRGVPSLTGGTGATANLKNRAYHIGDSDTFFGSADLSPNETETHAFNALIEHSFNNGLTVRNRTRYADYDKYYQNVYANGPVNSAGNVAISAYYDATDRENLFNQTDLLYTFKTGSIEHKMVLGMELGRQDTDNVRLTPVGGLGSVSAADPVFRGALVLNPVPNRDRRSEADITAFYLQDQVVLSPQWEVVLGLRHDRFDVDFTDKTKVAGDPARNLSSDDNLLSPRAGLIFKPRENLSLYGSYSLSYVPRSGEQLGDLNLVRSSLDPEKFINQEIGAKWDVTPELSVTAAIYKLERQKVEVVLSSTESALADGQETKGFELGVSGKVTGKWSVFGGYAYQDGEISEDLLAFNSNGTRNPNSDILQGAELAQTPEHNFSLWNRYDINATWGFALGVISRSEMYAQTPTRTTSTVLPGYTRYDAAIYGKLSEKLRLQVNLENLTNKEYALDAHNNNNITPGSPFTGRATLTYNF